MLKKSCAYFQGYPDEPEISGRTGLLSPSARRRNGPFTSPGNSAGAVVCIRRAWGRCTELLHLLLGAACSYGSR